jgi:hypothetical protein
MGFLKTRQTEVLFFVAVYGDYAGWEELFEWKKEVTGAGE